MRNVRKKPLIHAVLKLVSLLIWLFVLNYGFVGCLKGNLKQESTEAVLRDKVREI